MQKSLKKETFPAPYDIVGLAEPSRSVGLWRSSSRGCAFISPFATFPGAPRSATNAVIRGPSWTISTGFLKFQCVTMSSGPSLIDWLHKTPYLLCTFSEHSLGSILFFQKNITWETGRRKTRRGFRTSKRNPAALPPTRCPQPYCPGRGLPRTRPRTRRNCRSFR